MILQRWAAWLGGTSVNEPRARRSRRLRAGVIGSDWVPLESRQLMTIIAGPFYNPQDGTSAMLSEVGNQISAQITLAPNALPVNINFQSYNNATVYPTSAGEHNNGKQTEKASATMVGLLPGQTVTMSLTEGAEGTLKDGSQITGTQFDVYVDPVTDLTGTQVANVAAVIAYKTPKS